MVINRIFYGFFYFGFCIFGRIKIRVLDWVSFDSYECYNLVKYENIIVIEKYKI